MNARRIPAIALTALTLACATHDPNAEPPREEVVLVGSQDGRTLSLPIRHADWAPATSLPATREAVFRLLPDVYEELAMPPPAADSRVWAVAIQDFRTMRSFAGERMSNLIDCGMDMNGQIADTHRIRMSVRTWLEREAGGTKVRTRVEATASSVEGRPGSFPCTSRGRLEHLIAERLSSRIIG